MSLIFSDNFTRADSTTVGNGWVDTYNHFKIASNTLQAQVSTANLGGATTNAIMTAGVTTAIPVVSGGGSYAAGDLIKLENGTSNIEYVICAGGVTGTSIPITAPCVNTHASGVSVIRQRYIPLLRPVGENVRDEQVVLDLAALPASTQYLWSVYLRYQDAGNFIRADFTWSTFTQITCALTQSLNGIEGGLTTNNYLVTGGNVVRFVVSIYGTNPTTVDVKPFKLQSGAWVSLQTSTGVKFQTSTVSTASNAGVQSTGYCGLAIMSGSVNGVTNFAYYNTTDQVVAVNNANAAAGISPQVWVKNGSTYIQTPHGGAYIKQKFTGTKISYTQDTSSWQVGAVTGPAFDYSIDGGPLQYPAASTASNLPLAVALPYGTHTIEFNVRTMPSGGTQDLWNGVSVLRLTQFIIDAGESFLSPDLRPFSLAGYVDSLGVGPGNSDVDSLAFPQGNFIAGIAAGLDCEYGNIAFGGQGYGSAGNSSVPALYDPTVDANQSWNKIDATHSRLTAGQFTQMPDFIVNEQSVNDQIHATASATYIANIKGWLTSVRAAAPNAKIIIWTAFQGNLTHAGMPNGLWVDMQTAFSQYQAATPDQNAYLLVLNTRVANDFTTTIWSGYNAGTIGTQDGTHPFLSGEVKLIAYVFSKMMQALYPSIQRISSNHLDGQL